MLKFLIIVIIVFFVLRMVSRLFVASSFNAINKKMQEEMKRRQGTSTENMPEGSIHIDPSIRDKTDNTKNDDDFTDYEEVK